MIDTYISQIIDVIYKLGTAGIGAYLAIQLAKIKGQQATQFKAQTERAEEVATTLRDETGKIANAVGGVKSDLRANANVIADHLSEVTANQTAALNDFAREANGSIKKAISAVGQVAADTNAKIAELTKPASDSQG